MEQFLVLTTITEGALANTICAALEDANIPVMLEHIALRDEGTGTAGFRIMVPSHFRESAMRIVDLNFTLHAARLASQENLRSSRPNSE